MMRIHWPIKHLSTLTLVCLALLLAACSGSSESEKKTEDETKKPSERSSRGGGGFSAPTLVETYKVTRGSVANYQVSTGRVEASSVAPVYARVSELLVELNADVSDPVLKNTILAKLDDSRFVQELNKAKSATERAKRRLAESETEFLKLQKDYELRSSGDANSGLFSEDEVREAKLAMERAEIAKDIAAQEVVEAEANQQLRQLDVDACVIKAPISGIVARRMVEPHTLVQANAEVFLIAQLSEMRVKVDVPEAIASSLIRRTFSGETPAVLLQTTAHEGLGFLGKVVQVSPVVDPEKGMNQITVQIVPIKEAMVGGVVSEANTNGEGAAVSESLFSEKAQKLLDQFPPPVRANLIRTMEFTREEFSKLPKLIQDSASEEFYMLRPGMWVEASVVVDTKSDALVIPTTAVINGSVFVVEESKDDAKSGGPRGKGDAAKTSEAKPEGDKSGEKKTSAGESKGERPSFGGGGSSKKARQVDISKFIGMRGEGYTEVLPNDVLREGMIIVWRGMEYLKDGGSVKVANDKNAPAK
ncbi:MAG: efflux RND transporter periplasmic adaptor subunit [Planctomycetes bacterium]|nr:efflux RND transporter periplasmic adaptor subunit [Planctomycetota bacterium]